MIRLNVHEAKTNLSKYLDQVEAGETVILCRRNVPIAEIRRLPPARCEPREPGLGRALFGEVKLTDAFFDPLPDWMQEAFEGR